MESPLTALLRIFPMKIMTEGISTPPTTTQNMATHYISMSLFEANRYRLSLAGV